MVVLPSPPPCGPLGPGVVRWWNVGTTAVAHRLSRRIPPAILPAAVYAPLNKHMTAMTSDPHPQTKHKHSAEPAASPLRPHAPVSSLGTPRPRRRSAPPGELEMHATARWLQGDSIRKALTLNTNAGRS